MLLSQADATVPLETGEHFGSSKYLDLELKFLPQLAILASLGCGNPGGRAAISESERVLDLGSGGGLDVLLAAVRTGPRGHVCGIDMTDEMLGLARASLQSLGWGWVGFVKGVIEQLPFPNGYFDVVMANSVINFSPDLAAVLGESFRVLRTGGRIVMAEVLAEDDVLPHSRAKAAASVGFDYGVRDARTVSHALRLVGFDRISCRRDAEITTGLYTASIVAYR